MKRFVAIVIVSCGAREEPVARPEPQVLPSHVEVVEAGPPAPVACFEPRSATAADFVAARKLFDAKKWAEAAPMFRAIAFGASSDQAGISAAQLYVDALYELSREGRKVCFDDMERDVPKLRDVYCAAHRSKNAHECDTLDRIQIDVALTRAEALSAQGDQAKAAAKFLAVAQSWCAPATRSGCDEIAYDAAVSFLAAGDEASAKRVRALMADPKNKMDQSPLIEKIDCRIDPKSRPNCH